MIYWFIILFLYLFRHSIPRIMFSIRLFNKGSIKDNFRTAPNVFSHSIIMPNVEAPAKMTGVPPIDLPTQFTYKNIQYNSDQFLNDTGTTSLLVLKVNSTTQATIQYEQYFDKPGKRISWSMGKSIVAVLVGIAVDEAFIESVEDPVDKYCTQFKGTGYEGVSIKNCLQMSSGVKWSEDYGGLFSDVNMMGLYMALNWPMDSLVTSLKREYAPGTRRNYISPDTQVLGCHWAKSVQLLREVSMVSRRIHRLYAVAQGR